MPDGDDFVSIATGSRHTPILEVFMLHSSKNPRRALSGRLNDPRASEITVEGLKVLWTLNTLQTESPRQGFASRRRGDEIDAAIVAAEAYVSIRRVQGMASLN